MSEGRQTDVAPFPVVVVTIDDNGVAVNGEVVERDPDQSPREAAIDAVSRRIARALRRPVRTVAEDYTGRTRLVVHPDGHVSDVATLAPVADDSPERFVPVTNGAERPTNSTTPLVDADSQVDPAGPEDESDHESAAPPPEPDGDVAAEDTHEVPPDDDLPDEHSAPAEDVEDADPARVPDTENPWADHDEVDPFDRATPQPGSDSVQNPWITAAAVVNGGPGTEVDRQRAKRKSFIAAQPLVGPAQTGVRGALTRMGVRTHPSQ
ncbi:MAG: hypothetical protein L0K86_06155, partial [Actinomycetia bacterium]|nr:hypothetical protein [Actinomycetes bacterium]